MEGNKQAQYCIILKSDLNFHEPVEQLLSKIIKVKSISRNLLNKMMLCISEAITNAVIHGNKHDNEKSVKLEINVNDFFLEASIEDEGNGFDFNNLPNPINEANRIKEGGRGLYIIKMYSDSAEFKKDGSLLKMRFKIDNG